MLIAVHRNPSKKARDFALSYAAAIRSAVRAAPDVTRRRLYIETLREHLAGEEQRLAELQKEYNNGEPERLGSERNYQKYLDRVAELKAGIARKEADIAAIKREIGKLPQ
jgi:hypothetical protein